MTTKNVSASQGSIAVGRDIVDSEINQGLNAEDVEDALSRQVNPLRDDIADLKILVSHLSQEKGIEVASLQAVLEKFGEKGVPKEKIIERLYVYAERVHELQNNLNNPTSATLQVNKVQKDVSILVEKGMFEEAKTTLSDLRAHHRTIRQDSIRIEAELLIREAEINIIELDFDEAVAKLREAADIYKMISKKDAFTTLFLTTDMLIEAFALESNNSYLYTALDIADEAINIFSEEENAFGVANAQYQKGNLYYILADQTGDMQQYTSAKKELEAAIKKYSTCYKQNSIAPILENFLIAKNKMGNVLLSMSTFKMDDKDLLKAKKYFESVSTEWNVDINLKVWLAATDGLGNCYLNLGRRQSSTSLMKIGVDLHRSALQRKESNSISDGDAVSYNNLATILLALAETMEEKKYNEYRIKRIIRYTNEARKYFIQAANKHYEDGSIVKYAGSLFGLCNCLKFMFDISANIKFIEDSIKILEFAADIIRDRGYEYLWATTVNSLGIAYTTLGSIKKDSEMLRKAVSILNEACNQVTAEISPHDWAMYKVNQADALYELALLENNINHAKSIMPSLTYALSLCEQSHIDRAKSIRSTMYKIENIVV